MERFKVNLFSALFVFIGLIMALDVSSQSVDVNGVVRDANGQPLIGASVLLKGTTVGVVTDVNGNFKLSAPQNGTLTISYIGFVTQDVAVTGKFLNVTLEDELAMLGDVVVLGYGVNTKKQDLSAAVGVLNNVDKLAARPVSSTENMMQGQIAGVTIQSNGGDPTSVPSIVIRGQGSQNGDNVLWVVDGIPGAPISSMNDIESIVVLKDAASAAIYGAQSGAGGVVLVTTKKAKAGSTSVSYDGTFGVRTATNLPEPLNAEEQLRMRQMSFSNANMSIPDGWDVSKNPWIGTTRTDWMDEIFRNALYQRHTVALNGGSESNSNRLSFSYDDDQGVLVNTYNKSYSLRYNGVFNINKWLTFNQDVVWKNSESRSKDTNDAYTGPILSAIFMPSSATVINPLDGSWGGTTTEDPAYINQYGSNFAGAHGDAVNPVRLLKAENRMNKSSDIWTTSSLQLANIVTGLKFTSRFTYNLWSNNYKNFRPIQDEPGKPNNSNSLDVYNYRTDTWKTENTLTYDNTFGKHSVGVLLSTTADHTETRGLEVNGKDLTDESKYLQYLSFAETVTAKDYLTGPDANVSLVSRVAYSYDDRYFVTGSFRRDYAGRLPKEYNYGDFPAATVGWKISNEEFFVKSNLVSLLKLRASWGRVGNLGSIAYNYKSRILGTSFWDEQAQYGVLNNSTWGNFAYNSTAVNQKLTWETSEQLDLGIDLEMFKRQLSVSVDVFEKRTFNLIQSQTMNWPSTIGLNAMLVNQGEVKNTGLEIQMNWNSKITNDFSYFVSGNLAYLKNKVTDIGVKNADGTPGVWTESGSNFRNIPYTRQTAQGKPIGSYYLIKTAGIFQNEAEINAHSKDGKLIQPNAVPGDLKFVDYNNDGKIDDKDRQYVGNAMPKVTYALNLGATYKKLTVSAMLQGVGGAQAFYAGKYLTMSDVEGNFNRVKDILGAWSPTNTSSDIPRLSKNDPNSNFATPSDWYLEDASYLRLKNVTVSYDFSDILQRWLHLKERNSSLLLYFSGENLATITDYSGMDPETGGWDALKYPVSRVLSFGVKLTY
jgi:TonB-linked SusC/RagA family outer membrane protein